MNLDNFIIYLDNNGLGFKENSKAFILQGCPSCGTDKFKVYLYKNDEYKKLYGRCYKCGEDYDSFKYLIDSGCSFEEVKKLHDFGELKPEDLIKLDILGADQEKNKKEVAEYIPSTHSIDPFVNIKYWPKHMASKYAIGRGVTPELYDRVMIDPTSNAVVFLCFENGILVGYQYRYVEPSHPDYKNWNPPTFRKTQHVLEYANNGPIVVCEGPFTAISAYHYGFHAICTFGAGISERQLELIKNAAKSMNKDVLVGFDKDIAGISGFLKIKKSLQLSGINVKRIKPESGNDLNDSWKAGKGYMILDGEEDLLDITIPVLNSKVFKESYSE